MIKMSPTYLNKKTKKCFRVEDADVDSNKKY